MSTLQQIANWKSQRNPLDRVYGGDAIAPSIVARTQDSDNAMMILVSPDIEGESENLRALYATEADMNDPRNEQLKILIDANNAKGYDEMADGDFLDFRYPSSETRRGRVGHGVVQALQTDGGEGQAVCIFDAYNHRDITADGVAGTLGTHTNHGSGNCGTFYVGEKPRYRIRKLTERECFRLMGVRDEDSNRVATHQVKSSMYHLAGDSIVTACLMAIFGEMFGVDWRSDIKKLEEDIRGVR